MYVCMSMCMYVCMSVCMYEASFIPIRIVVCYMYVCRVVWNFQVSRIDGILM